MRPEIEAWRDAQDAWFGLAWEQPDINRAMRVIKADRAEARAELVEEIVAWLDDPAGDWPRATSHATNLARQIETKFGGRDG